MRESILVGVVVAVSLMGFGAGCGNNKRAPSEASPATAQQRAEPALANTDVSVKIAHVDLGGDRTMWIAPLRYRNLTLLPVSISPDRVDHTDYLTLDEGMKAKQIEIREVSSAGTVNALRLQNTSQQPLFAMAGEVVIGGKQDRIIGKTMVIAQLQHTEVPVFCVESGRWEGRKADFSSAESLAHLKLRNVADFGDQSAVWQEVAAKNEDRGKSNSTNTYRDVALQKGVVADYQESIDAQYAAAYPDGTIEGEQIVGFAIAYNGAIVGIEAFRAPKLFAKLRPKIMRSYYVEAIDRTYDETRSAAPMDAEAVTKGGRYKNADKKAKKVHRNDASETSSYTGEKMRGTSVHVTGGADDAPDADPLYESAELD